jgi:hypothetical protein
MPRGEAAVVAIALLVAGCAWDRQDPAAFVPVTDNPCGNLGVVCSDRMCCSEGEACGGDPGCPAGMCCDVRMPPDFLSRGDGGQPRRGMRPQTPQ